LKIAYARIERIGAGLAMKRREFIALIGGVAAAWPAVGRAQQSGRTRRIGVLFALAESDRQAQSRLAVFRGELQKLGWADITIDTRYVASNDAETLQRFAKELVALQPHLLLAQNTDATDALLQQTRIIPIIFTIVADPVGSGFVASFARPGGNVTGFVTNEPTFGGKWLELLKEVAPSVTRVLVPFNAATSAAEYYLTSLKATAALVGIDASAAFIRDISELEAVVAAHARAPLGGLVVIPDAYMTQHRLEVISLAARYRLPTVYSFRFFAESGGLLSYGSDLLDNFRRAAIYADRILKGAKPSELPVQAPEKFELVINLKTAKALGLTVPPTLLGRADEVIE
jgi:putative tryptophan/tyrosine transport system substrate-binding protein